MSKEIVASSTDRGIAGIVIPVKEHELLKDMKKLYQLSQELDNLEDAKKDITTEIDKKVPTLWVLLENNQALKKDFQKQFNDLKADIGKRGIQICEDSKRKNKKPALGVQITENENRILKGDHEEMIEWCIEKKMETLLLLHLSNYGDQLALGTIKDMPGEIDDTKILKARISLKPFEKEEDNG